jgi:hypothetical protein
MDAPDDLDTAPETEPGLGDEDFLLQPDLPPGVRVQLSGVVTAPEITTDVLERLGRAMTQLQQQSSAIPDKPACGRLRRCGSFRGGCPNLSNCGTYAPPGTPTV